VPYAAAMLQHAGLYCTDIGWGAVRVKTVLKFG